MTDHDMPSKDGLSLIRDIAALGPLPPTIMITGHGNETIAVEAMKAGADDYILKDAEARYLDLVPQRIEEAVKRRKMLEDKRLAELALQESDARYRSLYEKTPAILHSINAEGRIIGVSDLWLETLGYERSEVLGRSPVDFMTEESGREASEVNLPKFFRTGTAKDIRCDFVKKNGEILPVLVSAVIDRDSEGRFIRTLAVLTDLTDREKAEEARRITEERYRSLFDNSPFGVFLTTLEGQFISANRSLARILGYETAEELVGSVSATAQDLWVNPDDRQALISQLAQQGVAEAMQVKLKRRNGEHFIAETGVRLVLDGKGNPTHLEGIVQDISGHKKTEQDLREAKEQWELTFDAVPDSIMILDRRQKIVRMNKAAADLIGMSKSNAIGTFCFQSVHGTNRPHPSCPFALLSGQSGKRKAELHDHRLGAIFDVSVSPLVDGEGNLAGCVHVARDVTALRNMEMDLVKSVSELKRTNSEKESLLEVSLALLERSGFEQSARRIFDAARKATGAVAGYVALMTEQGTANEVLFLDAGGQVCTVDPSLPMPIRGLRREAYMTGSAVFDNDFSHGENAEFIPDGHLPLENVIFSPLLSDGKAVGVIGLANKPGGFNVEDVRLLKGFSDFTAAGLMQVRAEQKIAEQNAFLNAVLESLTHPFYVIDADNYQVTTANSAARSVFARDASCCYSLTHGRSSPCDSSAHPCPLEEVKKTGKAVKVEHLHYDRNGAPRNVEVHAFPVFDEKGRVKQVVEYALDVTERKKSEEKLRHLADELRQFTYIVSHDLRAPLINIRWFVKQLESAVEMLRPAIENGLELLPAHERQAAAEILAGNLPESLQFINSSVGTMNNLIERVLKLSRVGRVELFFQDIDMNELMDRVLDTFAHEIQRLGATVEVRALPKVTADMTAMEQIVGNLLGNAIKYRDPARRLEIAVSGNRFPDETVFVIRDSGSGVDQADLSRIFHAFERVGRQDAPGEGMGLAYVRTLVRRHGGRIWCESEPGAGSSFTFTIAHDLKNETEIR
jgi:PAS domain S-box-containing protein